MEEVASAVITTTLPPSSSPHLPPSPLPLLLLPLPPHQTLSLAAAAVAAVAAAVASSLTPAQSHFEKGPPLMHEAHTHSLHFALLANFSH